MPLATIEFDIQGGGVTIQKKVVRSANTVMAFEGTIPAAKAGTLTQRSDNTTGELQMASGHGIQTADVIDVYWSGGVQYGCTVGTVSGITVPFSGGSGDNLPSTSTAIQAGVQTDFNLFIDGDEASVVCLHAFDDAEGSAAGHIEFQRLNGTLVEALDLVVNKPQLYDLAAGIANRFSGAFIYRVRATIADTTNAATLRLIALVEN